MIDTRDWSVFYAAPLSSPRQALAGVNTSLAAFFAGGHNGTGLGSDLIDFYQCGNGKLDQGEECDNLELFCKNCTKSSTSTCTTATLQGGLSCVGNTVLLTNVTFAADESSFPPSPLCFSPPLLLARTWIAPNVVIPIDFIVPTNVSVLAPSTALNVSGSLLVAPNASLSLSIASRIGGNLSLSQTSALSIATNLSSGQATPLEVSGQCEFSGDLTLNVPASQLPTLRGTTQQIFQCEQSATGNFNAVRIGAHSSPFPLRLISHLPASNNALSSCYQASPSYAPNKLTVLFSLSTNAQPQCTPNAGTIVPLASSLLALVAVLQG